MSFQASGLLPRPEADRRFCRASIRLYGSCSGTCPAWQSLSPCVPPLALASFRFQHRISFMCVPYITLLFLPIDKLPQLFSLRIKFCLSGSPRIGGGQGVTAPPLTGPDFATSPTVRLFSRKLRLALFLESPDPLLGIRRPRDGSQGLRLVFHLAFHRTIGRLQEQALDPAIGFGGTRSQLSRDLLGFCNNRIVVDDVVDQSSRQRGVRIHRFPKQKKTPGAGRPDAPRHGCRRAA